MEIQINTDLKSVSETLSDLPENELLIENQVLDIETDVIEDDTDSINSSLTISDDENEYSIKLSLPGFDPENIVMEIENNILLIVAKAELEKNEKRGIFLSKEITYNSYSRSFKLPGNLENEKLEAEYKNGVLTLTFPKVEITSLEPSQESLLL